MECGVIGVDEFVIKLAAYVLQDAVKFFDVEDHASARVAMAGEGHAEDVVVAVAVRADTFAKRSMILFEREFRIPIAMRRFEFYEASEMIHFCGRMQKTE